MAKNPVKFWHGGTLTGVNSQFLTKVGAAARAAGATYVYVISGRRTTKTNTGVADSNHLTGHAMDGYAYVPGRGKVPLGTLLVDSASTYGLRSGDTAGFYPAGRWPNGTDPNHVDDGSNVNGGKPLAASQAVPVTGAGTPATGTPADAQTVTPTTTDQTGVTMQDQLNSDLSTIPQVGGSTLTPPPLVGGQAPDTTLMPVQPGSGDTWQLIASSGQVSQDTLRLASLASLASNGSTGQ